MAGPAGNEGVGLGGAAVIGERRVESAGQGHRRDDVGRTGHEASDAGMTVVAEELKPLAVIAAAEGSPE